ncbi:hypothetical protein FANTH_4671 [Fusarium anthophilum]|uniref:Uncharacterized protein n=1 Tax=Fusarium anthophilum TaxID=48485 RepID=A0A8H5E7J3_9HYPO|nr:hypothetical protein FANTH_4671 [Fusarium anthophilum]
MGLIQDEDGDVSIDLAVVVEMQNEIWALYISSADFPSLDGPQCRSGIAHILECDTFLVSGLEEVAREDDDVVVQEESRVDLGIVGDQSRWAVFL